MALSRQDFNKRNAEFIAKTPGISSLQEMMDLNKEHWHLSGYKHFDSNFKSEWFTPAKKLKDRNNGKYTTAPYGSKAYKDFWDQEIDRCQNGYKTHGYYCPGDLYAFLNYYKLPVVSTKGDTELNDRDLGHPVLWEVHYIWSHIVIWALKLSRDLVCLKPRGVGWSEYAANMGTNTFTTKKGSSCLYCASSEDFLTKDGVLTKAWRQLEIYNQETQRGFKHLRQKHNSALHKRASKLDKEGNESGWMSEIIGIVVDTPRKLRGARVNRLFMEEFGSFKNSRKSVATAKALTEIGGKKFGLLVAFGTGGDESSNGEALEGLVQAYNKPWLFNMLTLKHRFTKDGSVVQSGFFFPVYVCMQEFMNDQGITDIEKAYNKNMKQRKLYEDEGAVDDFVNFTAEYPFYAEEAFAKSGYNNFDRIKLANQLVTINNNPNTPKPERGELEWIYKDGSRIITGVKWTPCANGRILVIEKPELDIHGKPYKNLYIGGIDGIDMGTENSLVGDEGSKFCAVIKKRLLSPEKTGNMYVAYYLERPKDERIAYEIALKLAVWYGVKYNVERTRKEVISYFRQHKMLQYMCKQPSIVSQNISADKLSNIYGTKADELTIKLYLAKIKDYIADNYQSILFKDMVQQLIDYTYEMKRKFDIVAAMGMCELLDDELYTVGLYAKSSEVKQKYKTFGYYEDEYGFKQFGIIPDEAEKASYITDHDRLGFEVPIESSPLIISDQTDNTPFGLQEYSLQFDLQ